MRDKIRVHIADDHEVVIEGVSALINTDDSIQVEGYSLTGKDVVEWFKNNKADVLILDINMPKLDGIGVLKTFRNRSFQQKTIILSGLSDPKIVQEMIALGANGFIEKGSASEHIIQAIKAVHRGEQYYSDEIKDSLFDLYINESKTDEAIKSSVADEPLTEREIEVLKLITQELSTAEIADKLNITVKTIETHRRNLYKKLKVKNVVGLAIYAVKNNIV
ncbi:LuxR family two component transcriptional regulator [Tenacibaculum skagerrakense]|uniref:LuxR family two component transcriptional regulator n=1 Tax=Tenacibaculum skagerrakense TaxID=186571 RepID=A0A4R2P197_9FLAO|nr:response regulator transcription factor [Tenacibaculum skagerrakense]TCP28453.1 LuxR family two component transcriptional regulator [Tenacibaculum skagerrakense]